MDTPIRSICDIQFKFTKVGIFFTVFGIFFSALRTLAFVSRLPDFSNIRVTLISYPWHMPTFAYQKQAAMENLNRVLRYYEDITSEEGREHDSFYATGVRQRIKRFFDDVIVSMFGEEALLRRRSNRFFLKLVKVEEESTLTIQDKIILISKVITFCHETFGFAPGALEKMLINKVEEMKHSVMGRLN